jgi:hypothetical protein
MSLFERGEKVLLFFLQTRGKPLGIHARFYDLSLMEDENAVIITSYPRSELRVR